MLGGIIRKAARRTIPGGFNAHFDKGPGLPA
jgi:hypothetical protein